MYQRLRNSVKTLMNIKIHPLSACELPSTDISLRKEVSTFSPMTGFLQANEMFSGVTKKARREGRGSSEHKEAINEDEMNTLSQYFTKNMQGSLNGRHLQEIVLFNIIYFIGRRGRENLRLMTKNTFKVSIDPKERKYIHQVTSEHDKNHTENNSDKDNEARIYEQKGEHCYFSKLNCTTIRQ